MRTEPRYRINAVSEMTGIPAPTLRAWERRYGLPRPGRSESSYRLYSDVDVAEVRHMLALQARGLAPSDAARVVLESPPVSFPREVEFAVGAPATTDDVFERGIEHIVTAARAYDAQGLEREVQAALYLGSPSTVYQRVLSPVMVRVGELWAAGELDISAEHLTSHAMLDVLSHVLGLLTRTVEGPRVLLACIEEEQHELPVYGAALALIEGGFLPVMLGQRCPPSAVGVAISRLDPIALGLSVSVPYLGDDVRLFRGYVEAAAGRPVYVGGRAAAQHAPAIAAAGAERVPDAAGLRQSLVGLVGDRLPWPGRAPVGTAGGASGS